MDVREILMHILSAVGLPLFPLSMVAVSLMGKFKGLRSPVIVILPLVGLFFLSELEGPSPWARWLALITSVLYSFRALGVESLSRWLLYTYISAVALLWFLPPLKPSEVALVGVLYVIPFLVISLVDRVVESRFGSSNFRVVKGLGLGAPLLGFVITLSVLGAIGVPTSMIFAHFVSLYYPQDVIRVAILGLIWFFWGWSAIRVLSRMVFGGVRESIKYEDISLRGGIVLMALGAISFGAGYLFLELMSMGQR